MGVSKGSKQARRHQSATRDLQPRNGHAVQGGKKTANEVKVTQQQIEAMLQELQSAQK